MPLHDPLAPAKGAQSAAAPCRPTSSPSCLLCRAVNRLAVSDNGAFFVSASNDESIKVWDCRRLEKDVSFRSRLTYTGQGDAVGNGHAISAVPTRSVHGPLQTPCWGPAAAVHPEHSL